MLRLTLLGGALLEPHDGSTGLTLTRRHPLALLAQLAAEPSRSLPRGKIVGRLWAEFPEERARARLNTCVYNAREAVGEGVLLSVGDRLRLENVGLTCDLWAMREALDAGELEVAAARYGGPFLDGFWLPDAPSFEKWVDRERARIRRSYHEVLEALATTATERGDTEDAALWCRARFEDDPFDAGATMRLVDALVEGGDRAAALVVGERHARALRDELGVEPSQRVRDRLTRLRRSAAGGLPDGTGTEPTPTSLAVLPFENVSGTRSAEALAVGLHGDLLTDLAAVEPLTVISRTSVLRYRNTSRPLPRIASELGVRYVVEGEVQEEAGRVRVRVQLIDAERDSHRWAERWDRELSAETLFSLQSELARAVAARLEGELVPRDGPDEGAPPTRDLEAYRLFARARALVERRTGPEMQEAAELYRQAIDRDDTYAAARAGLAEALALLVSYQFLPPDPSLVEGERAARRALELEPDLAESHAALGLVLFVRRRGPGALRALYRALELRPGDADALRSLALALGPLGFWEEARPYLERAAQLDPASAEIHYCLGECYVLPGASIEDCLTHARRARELSPDYAIAYTLEGRILTDSGRPESALEPMRIGVERATEEIHVRPLYSLAHAQLRAGERAAAEETRSRVEAADESFFAGAAAVLFGDLDAAFARMASVEWTPLHAYHLRYDPALAPLREDDRFPALLRDVNRDWDLADDGSLPG